jgi:hypothetical protein
MSIMNGDNREKRIAQGLDDFRRVAEALAADVERMEESPRKRAIEKRIVSIKALIDAAHRQRATDVLAN